MVKEVVFQCGTVVAVVIAVFGLLGGSTGQSGFPGTRPSVQGPRAD